MSIHQKGLVVCDPKILNGKPIIRQIGTAPVLCLI